MYPLGMYTFGKDCLGLFTISDVKSLRRPLKKPFLSFKNHLKGDSGTSWAERKDVAMEFLEIVPA